MVAKPKSSSDDRLELKRVDGDKETLDHVQKLILSKMAGYVLTAKQLLAIGRIHGFAPRSTGTKAHIPDFLQMLGGTEIPVKERPKYEALLEDMEYVQEAHVILLDGLRKEIKVDHGPLEMLRLLVSDYASLDAWGSYTLVDVFFKLLDEIGILE